jgi:hypothetical protein
MMTYPFDTATIIHNNVWIDHLLIRIPQIEKDIYKYKQTRDIAKRPRYWDRLIEESTEILNLNKEYFKRITGMTYEEYINEIQSN